MKIKRNTIYLITGVGLLLLFWKQKTPAPANAKPIATGMEKIPPPASGPTGTVLTAAS